MDKETINDSENINSDEWKFLLVVISVLVILSSSDEAVLDKEQIIHNNLVSGVHCFVVSKQSGGGMSHLLCHLCGVRGNIQFAGVDVSTYHTHKQFILLHFNFLSALLALAVGRNPYFGSRCLPLFFMYLL